MKHGLPLFGLLLFSVAPVLAQTPTMPGWMSQRPIDLDRPACFARAQQALQEAGLENIVTQDGWSASGDSRHLHAKIQCVAVGGTTSVVSVNVASASGYQREGTHLRNTLRDHMLGQSSDSGTTTSATRNRHITLPQSTFRAAEEVTLAWSGLDDNPNNWIAVVPAGTPDNTWGTWTYTGGERAGSFEVGRLQPGEYEVRVYFDWSRGGYTVHSRLPFRVVE